MDGGRRGVNPAKLSRGLKLLGAEGEGECYFGVGDFLCDVFVVGEPDYVDPWEVASEAVGEPCGSSPEIEAVIGGNEQLFRRVIWRSGHRVIFIIYQPCGGEWVTNID